MTKSARNLALAAAAMALATPAAAQTAVTTLEPLERILNSLLAIMTGTMASVVGAITLAAIGYGWLGAGRIEKERAIAALLGIALIFGAAHIMDAFRTSTGF